MNSAVSETGWISNSTSASLLAPWPRASYLISLCFSLFLCKTGEIIIPNQYGSFKD